MRTSWPAPRKSAGDKSLGGGRLARLGGPGNMTRTETRARCEAAKAGGSDPPGDFKTMPAAVSGAASRPGYRYVVVWLLVLVYTLNFLARQLVSVLAEPIRKELRLSDTQLGLLGGI